MRKLPAILTLLFQVSITSIVLFTVYIIYAVADIDEADMINGIGFLIFQPLLGFLLTSLTILACLVAGLPIRLIKWLKQWWYTKPFIPLLGIIIGLLLLVLAFHPTWMETQQGVISGEPTEKQVPNDIISITGWFVTAFSLLHFYPQSIFSFVKKRKLGT